MISRREFGGLAAAGFSGLALTGLALSSAVRAEMAITQPERGDDGMYHQPWFADSFLVLSEDVADAKAEGKRFAVMWEQKGCPYCKETHVVNLVRPDIQRFIRANFSVLQLDLWGSRKVTDFDGEEMEERALARKWGIVFTPTVMFFDDDPGKMKGKSGVKSEVARMPGYFKPFHFLTMFEFVKDRAYGKQHFQKYIMAKGDRLRAEGKPVKLW